MKIKNIQVGLEDNGLTPNISFELTISYTDIDKFEKMKDNGDSYIGQEIRETLEAWSDAQMAISEKKPKSKKRIKK